MRTFVSCLGTLFKVQRRPVVRMLTGPIGGGNALPASAIEHGLDLFPERGYVLRGVGFGELQVAPPRVEVGGVRMVVSPIAGAVEVEDELVGREEHAARGALDTFGA